MESGTRTEAPKDANNEISARLDNLFVEEPSEISSTNESIYPELILQASPQGNRLYASFQRYTKQFVNDGENSSGAVRWLNSAVDDTQKKIVEAWLSVDNNGDATMMETHPSKNGSERYMGAASTLFSWSSGDAYIAARKKELEMRNGTIPVVSASDTTNDNEEMESNRPDDTQSIDNSILTKINIKASKESITNKLNRIVDIESNKFIRTRIRMIKAHHSEQMSKQIHERRRRDHEIQLSKLRLKEEEYEKTLHPQNDHSANKLAGFFGNLFNFNTSHTISAGNSVASDTEPTKVLASDGDVGSVHTPGKRSPPSSKSKKFSFLPVSGISLWNQSTAGGSDGNKEQKLKHVLKRENENEETETIYDVDDPEGKAPEKDNNISSIDSKKSAPTNKLDSESDNSKPILNSTFGDQNDYIPGLPDKGKKTQIPTQFNDDVSNNVQEGNLLAL
ncbi:uncharacterized protein PRCAT00005988001 [Priceomyces carsonii]|uniref:uncharacterized protein n=1 Tax=Priceomyces carsonii TaxID=28549 RepID=UPI002EDB5D52|nr:unnamed protein product [Priceomyces carsonii]